MDNGSLVSFGGNVAVTTDLKCGRKVCGTVTRLMTASEFKKDRGVKGSVAKAEYAAYLLENGAANTAGLAAAMTSGSLLVTKAKDWDNGKLEVTFVKKSSVEEKTAKPVEITVDDAEAKLAEAYGVSVEVLRALKAAK